MTDESSEQSYLSWGKPRYPNKKGVFMALLELADLSEDQQEVWRKHWARAERVARAERDRNRARDERSMGIGYDQGGNPFIKRYGQ